MLNQNKSFEEKLRPDSLPDANLFTASGLLSVFTWDTILPNW